MGKLTLVRAKVDCAGMTAPKELRASGTVNVGDSLTVESDTISSLTGANEIGCPHTANIKKTTISMYGQGYMKLILITDNFQTLDVNGQPALKQRWDGSFVAKVKMVPKYSDCIPSMSGKNFTHVGERLFIKSPEYPRFYGGDSQCRLHFTVGAGLKLVYKVLKLELKVRTDTCSADENDAILWLRNPNGCSNKDIFSEPGIFHEDALLNQKCGKSRKERTYTDLGADVNGACFIFAANGARKNEPASARTGRFLIEVKAVDVSYVPKAGKKKRKKRSISGLPYGPLGLID